MISFISLNNKSLINLLLAVHVYPQEPYLQKMRWPAISKKAVKSRRQPPALWPKQIIFF